MPLFPLPVSPGPSPSAPPPHMPWSAGNRRSTRSMATADADRGACRSWCSCWLPPPPIQTPIQKSGNRRPLRATFSPRPGFTAAAACTCSCIARMTPTPTSPTSRRWWPTRS